MRKRCFIAALLGLVTAPYLGAAERSSRRGYEQTRRDREAKDRQAREQEARRRSAEGSSGEARAPNRRESVSQRKEAQRAQEQRQRADKQARAQETAARDKAARDAGQKLRENGVRSTNPGNPDRPTNTPRSRPPADGTPSRGRAPG